MKLIEKSDSGKEQKRVLRKNVLTDSSRIQRQASDYLPEFILYISAQTDFSHQATLPVVVFGFYQGVEVVVVVTVLTAFKALCQCRSECWTLWSR